jgi:peptidoglycan-associated lipoprotein
VGQIAEANYFLMTNTQGAYMHMKHRITSFLIAFSAVLVMAGCSSGVKLDEAQVSDAKGVVVSPVAVQTTPSTTSSGTQTGVSQRAVEPVNVGAAGANAEGPAGVGKVILFDYDSYVIKPEYQGAVDAHARFLSANKGRKMAIEGHTDERGGREYNLALGQKRAEAVRRALALLGVTDAQIEAVSFGKEKPVDPAMSEAAFAKNRRAEINYR